MLLFSLTNTNTYHNHNHNNNKNDFSNHNYINHNHNYNHHNYIHHDQNYNHHNYTHHDQNYNYYNYTHHDHNNHNYKLHNFTHHNENCNLHILYSHTKPGSVIVDYSITVTSANPDLAPANNQLVTSLINQGLPIIQNPLTHIVPDGIYGSSSTVYPGTNVSLICSIQPSNVGKIDWAMNGNILQNTSKHIISASRRTLTVTNVNSTNSVFKCFDQYFGGGNVYETKVGDCTEDMVGNRTAQCNSSGLWDPRNQPDNCVLRVIQNLIYKAQSFLQTLDVITSKNASTTWTTLNRGNTTQNTSSVLLMSIEDIGQKLTNQTFGIVTNTIQLNRTNISAPYFEPFGINSTMLIDIPQIPVPVFFTFIVFSTLNTVLPVRNATNNDSSKTGTSINGDVVVVKAETRINNISFSFSLINNSLKTPQCVFWNFSLLDGIGGWDSTGCQLKSLANHTDLVTCECNHTTSFSILMSPYSLDNPALAYITYIGVSISMASLVLCLIIETIIWKSMTRNDTSYMRHVSIVNIAVSLLIADICFMIGASIVERGQVTPVGPCSAVTFFIHFFYLVLFFWMFLSALLLLYRTIMVFSGMSRSRMLAIAFSVGYGAPLLIAVITVASTAGNRGYVQESNSCWLNWDQTKALLAFAIPALTIVVINLLVLIMVIYKMLRRGVGASTRPDDKHALAVIARCVGILTPIFGLTWGFGIGTMVTSDLRIHVAFTILNSLQSTSAGPSSSSGLPFIRRIQRRRLSKCLLRIVAILLIHICVEISQGLSDISDFIKENLVVTDIPEITSDLSSAAIANIQNIKQSHATVLGIVDLLQHIANVSHAITEIIKPIMMSEFVKCQRQQTRDSKSPGAAGTWASRRSQKKQDPMYFDNDEFPGKRYRNMSNSITTRYRNMSNSITTRYRNMSHSITTRYRNMSNSITTRYRNMSNSITTRYRNMSNSITIRYRNMSNSITTRTNHCHYSNNFNNSNSIHTDDPITPGSVIVDYSITATSGNPDLASANEQLINKLISLGFPVNQNAIIQTDPVSGCSTCNCSIRKKDCQVYDKIIQAKCEAIGTDLYSYKSANMKITATNTAYPCFDEYFGGGNVSEIRVGDCTQDMVGNRQALCNSSNKWDPRNEANNCILRVIENLIERAMDVLQTVDVIASTDAGKTWQTLNRGNTTQNTSSVLLKSLEELGQQLSNETFGIVTKSSYLNRTQISGPYFEPFGINSTLLIDIPQIPVPTFFTFIVFSTFNTVLPVRIATNNDSSQSGTSINGDVIAVKAQTTVNNISFSFSLINNSLIYPQCVFWNFDLLDGIGGWDSTGCELKSLANHTDLVTCECNHTTSFSILMSPYSLDNPALAYITYIGVSISMASLVLCLIIETIIWKSMTRNDTSYMRHVSIVNIALSLLIADICFFIGASIVERGQVTPVGPCSAVTFFIHFFYLVLFFWMFLSALLLLYRTIMVFSGMSRSRMLAIAFSVGYGAPLLIAVITVASTAGNRGYVQEMNSCWLNWNKTKALLAFVIPALTIVVINLLVLVVVLYKMLRRGVGASTQPDEKHALVVIARCVAILTPLFGLTWGFGIGTMVTSALGIHVVFATLNSLQIREALASKLSLANSSNRTMSSSAGPSSSSGLPFIQRLRLRMTRNDTSYMRHVSIVNIAVSLLIADICLMIGASIVQRGQVTPVGPCSAVTFFIHFFYLVLFFWMFLSALLLLYRTIMVFSGMSRSRMLAIAFSVGYGAPLLIAVITVASTAGNRGYVQEMNSCWLNWDQTKALLAFVIPALTIVVINLLVLIMVIYKMLRRGVGASTPDEKHALVVIIRCVGILTPLFGLTWGFGIGTMVTSALGIHVVFATLNSLQSTSAGLSSSSGLPFIQRLWQRNLDTIIDVAISATSLIHNASPSHIVVAGGLWNCQSAVQKADFISTLASLHFLHFLALTETWITPENSATPAALSSAFSFTHSPRHLDMSRERRFTPLSFSTLSISSLEFYAITVSFPTKRLIIVIYRPPGSLDHFIDEIDILLSQFPIEGNLLILLGDFNLPSDCKLHSSCILPLLTAFDLTLNLSPLTHKAGNFHPYHHNIGHRNEILQLLTSSNLTTCPLDPIPSALFQTIARDLLPFISVIINNSLSSGYVPTAFKTARVVPILKKATLGSSSVTNYRPNQLHDPNQSGYKPAHSTEMALIAVTEKLHAAKAAKQSSVLILLDLSAAFDTVNHNILLFVLSRLGVTGSAWRWFQSYLDGWSYQVSRCISACLTDIASWMTAHHLKLNPSKTEVLLIPDVDECLQTPSLCGPNSFCVNTFGGYICFCSTGFIVPDDITTVSISNPCIDVDECMVWSFYCGPNSNCVNTVGSYTCSCSTGFTLLDSSLSASFSNPCRAMHSIFLLGSAH
ncbi:hypothetical protein P4O66_001016 [Electrophorus voltai]|uniref:Uncharacterized protein n=1 Tax=Electrophorus voltai TaxID=2609070 RepID=A0AAD8ZCX0_9TELE|nr:hypothetical protein P4O66_001016 [Electrophorus voltai]